MNESGNIIILHYKSVPYSFTQLSASKNYGTPKQQNDMAQFWVNFWIKVTNFQYFGYFSDRRYLIHPVNSHVYLYLVFFLCAPQCTQDNGDLTQPGQAITCIIN